jgi:hypothetical protein
MTTKCQILSKVKKRERLAPPEIDDPNMWLVNNDMLYRKVIADVIQDRDDYFVKTARVVWISGHNRGAGPVVKVLKEEYPDRVIK